jgi:hypothetical protein
MRELLKRSAFALTGFLLVSLACLFLPELARGCTVTVTSANPPAGQVGIPYSTQLTASGCNGSYTWSVLNGAVPLGTSLDPSGLVSGTPALLGQYFVTVVATDSSSTSGSASILFSVSQMPQAVLAPSPTSFSFSAAQGGANPAAQPISVTSNFAASFSIASSAAWLSVSPPAGNTPATDSVSVNITGRAQGTYNGTLTFTPSDPASPSQTVPVTLTVSPAPPPPALSVAPLSLSFSGQAGGANPGPQSIQINNTGGGTLSFTASKSQSWLTVSPSSGSAPNTLTASVNIASLQAGSYSDSIQVSAAGAQNSPQTVGVTLTVSSGSPPSSGAPAIFFTDLTSGPNTGGQNNDGTILTIYGKRLGSSQGSSIVLVGGNTVASYLLWSDSKVSVAIGPAAATGSVIIHTTDGTSNGVPFTVRSGNIYCISTAGSDNNPGTFSGGCWATPPKARDAMQPGDITYLENGVVYDTSDGARDDVALTIYKSGTPGNPLAMVAYPGATVTLGDINKLDGIRILPGGRNTGQPTNHWVFAGLTLRGGGAMTTDTSIGPSTDYRIVGNDFSCPNGDGQTGCYADNLISGVVFYGNNIHDVSSALPNGSSKQYHSVYFSTDANHIDFGWNQIHNDKSCRAIQFHSSPVSNSSGNQQFDLHVHDNVIHDNPCDGINFATVDPSKGTVEAYNNVVYSVGKGPDPPDGASNYACIYFPGILNNGAPGGGTALVYNNTFYDCGANGGPYTSPQDGVVGHFAGSEPNLSILFQNNIVYQKSGEPYVEPASNTVRGDHNVFFGNGPAPSGFSNSLTVDPLFVNLSGFDFRLRSASPAIQAGINIPGLLTDQDGEPRPSGQPYDLGAFQFIP